MIIPKENWSLLLPIGFIFLHVLRERLELRPEIFSFLFTAISVYILNKYIQQKTKLIYLLPLIQLIWINTHIYFFVGLILEFIFLIDLFIRRRGVNVIHPSGGLAWHLVLILLLSLGVSLINPNGIRGLLYPLNVNANYGYSIVENQTMFLLQNIGFRDPNFLFVKLAVTICAIALFVAAARRVFDLRNILLVVFGAGLALLNVRSFPYLIFLSLPSVMISLGSIKRSWFTNFLSVVTFVLLITESFLYLNGDYYKYIENPNTPTLSYVESGEKALDFVLANNLPQPIFNNFDIGSYIIYRGFPKYRVFVDGRPEAYPAEFFLNTYIPDQYDYNKFKILESQVNFKTIIFSHTDQTPWGVSFLKSVVADSTWKIVYIDDFMIILTKPEVTNQKQIPILDLAQLNPDSYQFSSYLSYLKLGLFLLRTQNTESAGRFIEKTLKLFPKDPIANSLIGNQLPTNWFFW